MSTYPRAAIAAYNKGLVVGGILALTTILLLAGPATPVQEEDGGQPAVTVSQAAPATSPAATAAFVDGPGGPVTLEQSRGHFRRALAAERASVALGVEVVADDLLPLQSGEGVANVAPSFFEALEEDRAATKARTAATATAAPAPGKDGSH